MNSTTRSRHQLPQLLLGLSLIAGAGSSQALNITFDYSYDGGFFTGSNSARQSILQSAGDFFGQRIGDNLTAITSSGSNSFNAKVTRPDTGDNITLNDYSVAADTLVIFAGGRDITSLGIGGPGGYSASGSQAFLDSLNRGQGTTSGPGATDFGPWGGDIVFDSSAGWYFDSNPGTDEVFVGNDFYSVALHEIGHVLGFGNSHSWSNQIDSSNATFTGAHSVAANGGGAVPLADTGHWLNGLTSVIYEGTTTQEVAMDPNLTTGTRKRFTDLDMAGLQDVGWEVSAVPLPAAVWLFGSGLIGLLGVSRRRRA